jgi:deoxyribodipyrimidine photolyase-related protein
MMEVKEETSYVLHHAQKIIATFAAMRFFAKQLQQKGFEVIYFKINDKENEQGFIQNINKTIKERNISELQYQEPDEYRLSTELKKLESIENIKVESLIQNTS